MNGKHLWWVSQEWHKSKLIDGASFLANGTCISLGLDEAEMKLSKRYCCKLSFPLPSWRACKQAIFQAPPWSFCNLSHPLGTLGID